MQLPLSLIKSLEGLKGFNKEAFERIHASGEQVTSIRVNPRKFSIENFQPGNTSKTPWSDHGYYLASRPSFTFDPLFHAGCYYVQEASSMFLEQAMKQSVDLTKPIKVLDLCAAPGGKSTHIQSLVSGESLLVSNEVIRPRAGILKDNIIKWGCENVVVTNNDPRDFSKLKSYFDVIVVDAPCSGSGLFRRDPDAIEEWSENNVQLCSQRQQRILADIWPSLKEGGILIYSTCSYSEEEDERIVQWLRQEYKAESISLSMPGDWNIVETDGGYRFWPDKVKGEGFFIAVLKKVTSGENAVSRSKDTITKVNKAELSLIQPWVKTTGTGFVKNNDTVYAWSENKMAAFNFLLQQLKVLYSGVLVGELLKDKLLPDHALAMSLLAADNVNRLELDYEQAIAYLQRKDLRLAIVERGWTLAEYAGHPLGWMNILPGRINNYYPKELRILKESPE